MFKKNKNLQKAQKREAENAHKNRGGKYLQEVPAEELPLYDQAILSWTAPEYVQHQKSLGWYVGAAIVAGFLILSSLFMQNWTMAIAIIAFGAVYQYFQVHHPPKKVEVKLSKIGIKVGKMVFPYSHIQAFWIFYDPPMVKTLTIRVHKQFFTDVVIQLDGQDPVELRQFLCGQIPEWEGKHERFGDILLRLLKL